MGVKKYYAVAIGRVPGIYESWDECQKQVDKFGGAVYKSFPTRELAEQYVSRYANTSQMGHLAKSSVVSPMEPLAKPSVVSPMGPSEQSKSLRKEDNVLHAFVDGSYSNGYFGFGCVFIVDGHVINSVNGKGRDIENIHNVMGELTGVVESIRYALQNGFNNLVIHYDYIGIEMWATGKWKANKKKTQEYVNIMSTLMNKMTIKFVKVKAHTGDKYNEMADTLAKKSLGIL